MTLVTFCPRRRAVYVLVAVAAILIVARIWPAPEVTPRRPAPLRFFPLAGEPLHAWVDEADGEWDGERWVPGAGGPCVPFLADLVAHDDWELQIMERTSGCTGIEDHGAVTIGADGNAVVTRPGLPPLRAHVTAAERDAVRALDPLSCVRTEPPRYGDHFFELGWGPTRADDGARVSSSSEMGAAIDALARTIRVRAAEKRLALTPFTLRLAFRDDAGHRAPFVLEIDAGATVTVRRNDFVFLRETMDPIELADIVDTIAAGGLTGGELTVVATGSAVIDGERYPIQIEEFERSMAAQSLSNRIWAADRVRISLGE